MTVLPFEQSFDRISLAGKDILKAFEIGSMKWEEKTGGFLQVSGFKVVFNMSASPGARVRSVQVLQQEGIFEDLEDNRMYSVVVSQYLANGGDGHVSISENM